MNKARYSAFHGTDLDALPKSLEVDTVVIIGLVIKVYVQRAAADDYFRGYDIVVPRDCVEARSAGNRRPASAISRGTSTLGSPRLKPL